MKKTISLLLITLLLVSMGGAALAEGKTIVYWSMWGATEPQGIAIQKAVDAYMEETGNTVDLQFKNRTGIREGLQPALDAGMQVDLFDEDVDRVNITWGEYILDLEEMAKAANYEETAIASLVAVARQQGGGTLKSIPYQPFVYAMFYNPDIFEEAGVTQAPENWEAFLDACEKIKAAGYIPLTCDDAYIVPDFGIHLARLVGPEKAKDLVDNGGWAAEPKALEAAQLMEDLYTKGYLSETYGTAVYPLNQNGEFGLGLAAMNLNGSWLPNEIKEMAGEDFAWGCFAYPTIDADVNGAESGNFGSQVYGVNKNSEVAQEAFDLIMYIVTGEYDQLLAQESNGIPADTTNSDWPPMIASVKSVLDQMEVRWEWGAGAEGSTDYSPILQTNLKKLCTGGMTAQEFIDTMDAAYK